MRKKQSFCQSGSWNAAVTQLERMTWDVSSGQNYGDICQASLKASGLLAQGWISTGSDACTEDDVMCSVDNVKCFAIKLK